MWTTVDKVVRILVGLGLVTEKQRKLISKDRRVQSLFAMKSGFISSVVSDADKRAEVLAWPKPLVATYDHAREISRERLLRDTRLYLSTRGAEIATSLQAKYAGIITRETYLAECTKQEAEFESRGDKIKGAIVKRYRGNVEKETGGTQNGA